MTELADIIGPGAQRRLRRATGPPAFVRPMKATISATAFDDPGWLFERKYDGARCLVVKSPDALHLYSRNGNRLDRSFPELAAALDSAGTSTLIADGEIVAFDDDGRTSFPLLQRRLHRTRPDRVRSADIAPELFLFDVLRIGGADLTQLPLIDRKGLLHYAVDFDGPIHYSEHVAEFGTAAFTEACRSDWEGIVAKRAASRYVHRRSRDWLKLKCVREQEFAVVGYTEPGGLRRGFGALLVAYHDNGFLRYAGRVGSGFSEEFLDGFSAELEQVEVADPPVIDPPRVSAGEAVHWVEPVYVAQVAYGEWTPDQRLRHPRFRGLRDDVDVAGIVREEGGVT